MSIPSGPYYFDFPMVAKESLESRERYLKRQRRFTPVVAEAFALAYTTRETHNIIGYCAGALTGVSDEMKARYERIFEISQKSRFQNGSRKLFIYVPHLFGTDPKKHPQVTPTEVRDIDHLWAVLMAQFHINCLDPMAHGNAIEEGWAESVCIPSIFMVPQEITLSRLTRGMENIDMTIRYQIVEDAYVQLEAWLEECFDSPGTVLDFFIKRKFDRGELRDPVLDAIETCARHTSQLRTFTLKELYCELNAQGIRLNQNEFDRIVNAVLQDKRIFSWGIQEEDGLFVSLYATLPA